MTQQEQRRLMVGILAYLILIFVIMPASVAGTIYLITRNDPPCPWEDCVRLKDLPPDRCVRQGDAACLVVPD